MLTPFPTQISGAKFLANRQNALLADEPRVGKTGAAILAADYNLDETILVVTTASGRPVWRRAFDQWSNFGRSVGLVTGRGALRAGTQVGIVGWPSVANNGVRSEIRARKWDRIILDESHYAKNFETHRTQAVFGNLLDGGGVLADATAIAPVGKGIWCLTGTPLPNSPADLYPMMRALCWERLGPDAAKGWPNVIKYHDFLHRYCIVRMKKLPRGFRKIPVVIGGRNLEELRERLGDFMLRRTQADVGIREPVYETLPLVVSEANRRAIEVDDHAWVKNGKIGGPRMAAILEAAERGDTKKLELDLGPLRRLTGEIKARAVVEAVKEEFEGGLDKIVVAYWHRDVGALLKEGLSTYGVVGIDGATPANTRGEAEQRFLHDPKIRVFLGQIQAAGEAIDLSAAATLWFAETSLVPKDMKQMSLRVTNYSQKRQVVVRVCVIEGSIDDALQQVLMRKWTAIREVLTQ